VVECIKNASWNGGGCVPAGTPTLKSVEIKERGFIGRVDSTLGIVKSPLYIEVDGCRAVVMAHLCPVVTKSWEV